MPPGTEKENNAVTDTLSTKDLSKRWGVTETHLRRLRQEGAGPPYFRPTDSTRGRVRYRLVDIEQWEAERLKAAPRQ